MEEQIKKMILEVEQLNNNTPDGQIVDADTILVDIIENCDYLITGMAQDIFNIWKNSNDKKAVEQMFYEFTDIEFEEYLEKCKQEITREEINMAKYKIKMTHTVELFVEAENEEVVQDWMNTHTPEEVLNIGYHHYDDEIVCPVRDDSFIDLTIE